MYKFESNSLKKGITLFQEEFQQKSINNHRNKYP